MHEHIYAALLEEQEWRGQHRDWVERERTAMAVAGNSWAEAQGLARRLTVADVERLETRALGHSDYSSKVTLYLAEWFYEPAAAGRLFGDTPSSAP